MTQTPEFWDHIAAKYAKSPIADMKSYEYTLGRTRSYLASTDGVLEIGCGTGSTALLLAKDVDHITASDLSSNMIRIGEKKARDQNVGNISFVTASLFDDALSNGPYDVVLALNVLHLLDDTSAAIHRMRGLLKPGGLMITKTPCLTGKGMPLKIRLMKIALPVAQLFGKAPYVNMFTMEELERAVIGGGFQILEAGTHPSPSRYIVAKKV